MVKITITEPTFVNGKPLEKNSKIEVSNEIAVALINARKAVLTGEKVTVGPQEKAVISPDETPEKPKRTTRKSKKSNPVSENIKDSPTE